MTPKPIHEEEQYKQKCYQNQYVEDPKHKFIKVQTISPLNCKLFNSEKAKKVMLTNHLYESIGECSDYQNCQPQSRIFTHQIERGTLKNNKEFVGGSGYLFYNVITIDPSIRTGDTVFNCEMLESKPFHRDFHSYRRPKSQPNEYENYRSFRVVRSQK